MITGAAAGIIGCLSGQGIIALLNKSGTEKLEEKFKAFEAKELVLKNDPNWIGRAEIQGLMNGFAQETQNALNQQHEAHMMAIQQSQMENAKAVRIAEARTQVVAPSQPAMNQAMVAEIEALKRQVGMPSSGM